MVIMMIHVSIYSYVLYYNIDDTHGLLIYFFKHFTFGTKLRKIKKKLPEFDEMYYSDFCKVLFVFFIILMHILLINMLIAMMGNTYQQIIKKSEKEYYRQVN